MYLSKPQYGLFLSLIFSLSILFSCSDAEIRLLKEPAEVIIAKQVCYLKNADQGNGTIYNLSYDTDNQLILFKGFPDFNQIKYENSLPKKVASSFDDSFHFLYEYDTKGNLTLITFVQNTPSTLKSRVSTNTKNQIEGIDLHLPAYSNALVTKLEYDASNNIKKVILVENGKNRTILENLSFDDKKSPYSNTSLGNILLYYTIFSATSGSSNTSYFQNKNNVTSSKIHNANGDIIYNYQYEYTADGYASKVKVSKKQNDKEVSYEENYTYTCK